MLLKIMAFARDVTGDLETVGQADTGNLAQRRVRFLRRRRVDARADAALLRDGVTSFVAPYFGRLAPYFERR